MEGETVFFGRSRSLLPVHLVFGELGLEPTLKVSLNDDTPHQIIVAVWRRLETCDQTLRKLTGQFRC